MKVHPVVHIELSANNMEEANRFYQEAFGWKTELDPAYNYLMFQAEGGPGGGFVQPDGQMYKPGDVLVYLGTDDIESSLQKVESLGGKTLVPKTEIPNVGWFAFFTDPTGNRLGLFQGKG